LCKRKYKAWLFYRISISNVPIMHRYNDNSQNACFLFCKIGTFNMQRHTARIVRYSFTVSQIFSDIPAKKRTNK